MTVETKREPASQVTRDPSALGLCCTCIHVDLCTGRATWVGPVHHCEEFDDSGQEAKKPKLQAVPQPTETAAASPQASKRSGLCVNCAHRDACTFPIVEGGIWHCEEYE